MYILEVHVPNLPLDIIRFVGSRVFIILTAAEDDKELKKLGGGP